MNPAAIIASWILVNLLAVGVYDLAAYFCLLPDQSVSYWLQRWSQQWPIAGVFVGIVLGHLFWPLHRGDGKGE